MNAEALLSISIGVTIRHHDDDVESLVERADQAMYDAKLKGRNRVCMYRQDDGEVRGANPSPGRRLHIVERRESDK